MKYICLHVDSSPQVSVQARAYREASDTSTDDSLETSEKTAFVPGTCTCAFCSLLFSLKLNQYLHFNSESVFYIYILSHKWFFEVNMILCFVCRSPCVI